MRLILFDLDGTLIDSALDLGWALNQLLAAAGKPACCIEAMRPWVSGGAGMIVRNGFQIAADDPQLEALKRQLVGLYAENPLRYTVFFPGVVELLAQLEARGLQWGIVTNKMGWLTTPIVQGLQLTERAACVVSGDTLAQQKPDPAPLLHACALAGARPEHTLYIGDAHTDIMAGQRAGMRTLAATYGYIAATDNPAEWGATGLLADPSALLTWLDQAGC
jgi:phosphoglycolate phosphatase